MNDPRDRRIEAETRTTGSVPGVSEDDLRVPGLTILAHPDPTRIGDRLSLPELVSGQGVSLSRLEPTFLSLSDGELRPLLDTHLSRSPIRLRSVAGEAVALDLRHTRTRVEIGGRRLQVGEHLLAPSDLDRGVVLVLGRRVVLLLHRQEPLPRPVPSFDLVGESAGIQRVRREIERISPVDVPVLLRGETGTGKELVAKAIHRASRRRDRPWVAVNMAAIPSSLAASELFGAAKGAYTGADQRKVGYFEKAQGGTLFLDEIGETPPDIQAMLLRALENREIQPVGAVEPQEVDVRVVAATDSDLESQIRQGKFRAPLLHRLAGYEILLPPLRDRREDVGRLLYYFLDREVHRLSSETPFASATGANFPPAWLVARAAEHDWPGNVRQLANFARRVVISAHGGTDRELRVLVDELLAAGRATGVVYPPQLPKDDETVDGLEPVPVAREHPSRRYRKPSEVDEDELLEALREHDWMLKPTAEALGVSRGSLYVLIEECSKIRKAVELESGEIEAALVHAEGDVTAAARHLEVSVQGLKRRLTDLGLPH